MKFTVSSEKLYDAMKPLKRVLPSNATMPMLENVLIRKEENEGLLVMRATDLEAHVVSTVSVQFDSGLGLDDSVSEVETAAIPAGRILSTLKAMPGLPVEIIIDDDYKVRLETDQGEYEMMGMDGQDFPDLPSVDPDQKIDAAPIQEELPKVDFCVSTDALRPAMMGAYLDSQEEVLVATDGHRLSKVPCPELGQLEEPVIISGDGIDLMQRVVDGEATLSIGEDGAWAIVEGEQSAVYTRLIDETFPNYDSVIPSDNEKELVVDREELKAVTKRTGIYASSQSHSVRFLIEKDQLTVDAKDVERSSEAEESIACDFDGEEAMEIGFNSNYLEEMLGNTNSDEVVFELGGSNTAGIINPPDEDLKMLLMPVMVNV
jgi:DNA polymerase-3 subunit beta